MLRMLFILLLCNVCIYGHSQSKSILADTVFSLKEVTISAKRLNQFSSGLGVRKIDSVALSIYSSSNLSQLLTGAGVGQVNTYGPGASSISTRGTTSYHTAVLWNGLNLQDMFNGGTDLSQIQSGFIDEIYLQPGGSSALFGSGAIGGVIHLNTSPQYNKGLSYTLKTGLGSFNNQYYGGNLSYSGRKYYQEIKVYLNDAANNYPFRRNGITDTLSNARRAQSGFMIGQGFKPSANNEFDLYFWNQNNSQDIMTTTSSGEHQSDNRNMINGGWKYTSGKTALSVRSGINYHILYYNYTSRYTSLQIVNEALLTRRPDGKSMWNAGANFSSDLGWFPGEQKAKREQYALFGSYKFELARSIYLYANIRQGVVNSGFSPFTYSAGFEAKQSAFVGFRGNFSRNYRVPTLNDLFYPGAGKKDLKSENGYSSELAVIFNKSKKQAQFRTEIVAFNNIINNLIQWQPIDAVRWNPFNIGKAWARGIENHSSFKWNARNLKIQTSVDYAYTLSTNEHLNVDAPETYKKQLIYIPRHKASGNFLLSYKHLGISYTHLYNGLRYYEQDNSRFVKSFQTGDLSVFADIRYARQVISCFFSVHNIWDSSYEVIRRYPMPLRNYQIRIQISLNHKEP